MTVQGLALQENLLYSKVSELYHEPRTPEADQKLEQVFTEYRKVHQTYADLSESDIEALKRGLFIQWYAMTEPNYLTGINDIDNQAGEKIIQVLNKTISAGSFDAELVWMLNYYFNWSFAFEIYKNFREFDQRLINDENNKLPETIDREAMEQRGQMGIYWNSLSQYS